MPPYILGLSSKLVIRPVAAGGLGSPYAANHSARLEHAGPGGWANAATEAEEVSAPACCMSCSTFSYVLSQCRRQAVMMCDLMCGYRDVCWLTEALRNGAARSRGHGKDGKERKACLFNCQRSNRAPVLQGRILLRLLPASLLDALPSFMVYFLLSLCFSNECTRPHLINFSL